LSATHRAAQVTLIDQVKLFTVPSDLGRVNAKLEAILHSPCLSTISIVKGRKGLASFHVRARVTFRLSFDSLRNCLRALPKNILQGADTRQTGRLFKREVEGYNVAPVVLPGTQPRILLRFRGFEALTRGSRTIWHNKYWR